MGDGFYVAPYPPDGELLGVGFHSFKKLNSKWLNVAARFLEANGDVFRASWGQQLAVFETKLTYSQGVGLCTFYVSGEIVSSHLVRTGRDTEAERSAAEMFVQSMRGIDRVRLVTKVAEPFGDALSLRQRPLDTVVFWAPPTVSEQLHATAAQLALHFVAAIFRRGPPN